jgi:hypothetical protein
MHPDEVAVEFDEPRVHENWMGGNLNDAMLFHGLRFHFDRCNGAGPLPDALLNWIVVHQREDAYLFDRPMTDWTKETLIERLVAERLSPSTPPNGDVEVPGLWLGASFDSDGRLNWLEVD